MHKGILYSFCFLAHLADILVAYKLVNKVSAPPSPCMVIVDWHETYYGFSNFLVGPTNI